MEHAGPHEESLCAAKSLSPTHMVLDPGRLSNSTLSLPLIQYDQGPSSNEAAGPNDDKPIARCYLSDSPYSIS